MTFGPRTSLDSPSDLASQQYTGVTTGQIFGGKHAPLPRMGEDWVDVRFVLQYFLLADVFGVL